MNLLRLNLLSLTGGVNYMGKSYKRNSSQEKFRKAKQEKWSKKLKHDNKSRGLTNDKNQVDY